MSGPVDRLATALSERYRIERELGRGGMATVYLAEDLKHDRKVALKVLKPELAAVLGAERFVQEIKTTAALQHPHILPLFDSGAADGFLYYVMPFIDGETLRTKLDRETQLGIDESVRITVAVADALDYAHRHGVIHRDIKPENILLHDGRPMVADFGIALALSAAAGGRMTETGMSLGTPHYMSPEQATADKEITGRSDIYSLGSVLYEMLAGNPPHTGSSAQQIIMRIVTDTARPVTEVRKSVPPNVAAALARSLEKLPADRFGTARQFADALANPAFATAVSAGVRRTGRATTGRRLTPAPAFLLGAGLMLLAAAGAWWRRAPGGVPSEPWRVRIMLPDSAPLGEKLSLSPDGSILVYDGGGRLWMRTADAPDPVPLAGADGGLYPVIAPDGQRVAFFRPGSTGLQLLVMPLGGGAPRIVVSSAPLGVAAAWADDDHLIYSGLGGLIRVPVSGGDGTPLTTVDSAHGETFHAGAAVSPDGQAVIFAITRRNFDSSFIAVVKPGGGSVTTLFPGRGAVFAPPGHLIVTGNDGSIVAVPFDSRHRRITGPPVTIVSGLHSGSFSTVGSVAVSATGRLIYVAGGWGQTGDPKDLVWVSPTGVVTPADTSWVGGFQSVAVSPDGRRIAAGLAGDRAEYLVIRDRASGSSVRVEIPGTLLRDPSFAPDGRLYFAGLGASHGVHRIAAGATGIPERILASEFLLLGQPVVARDGDHLYYFKATALADRHIFRYSLSAKTTEMVSPDGVRAVSPRLSPDGHWLAFLATTSGPSEVHVRSVDQGRSEDWLITASANRGTSLRWSPAGDDLYFQAGRSMMSAHVSLSPSFESRPPVALFSVAGLEPAFDVAPDGRFLMIRPRPALRPPTELIMLERWTDLLTDRRRR